MYAFSYPVEVKIEMKAVPKLEFPSVTICNLNPLKKDHMHDGPFALLRDYFELDDTDSLYDDYWEETRKHLEGGTLKINPYLRSGLFHSYQLDESISKFRGVWCTFFIFILFLNKFLNANSVDSDQTADADRSGSALFA